MTARQEQALRWLAGPCDRDTTPGHRCWLPGENRTPDAPYSAYRWCESCTAAYGLGEGPDISPLPVPQPNLDGAQVRVYFSRGPADLYEIYSLAGLGEVLDTSPGWTAVRVSAPLPSRGKDNAAGLRGTVARLQTLDENGRPKN